MIDAEAAAMHGHLSATVKGHAAERARYWRRALGGSVHQTGQANVAGWQQLAALTAKAGLPVQQGGEALVQ